MNKKTRWAIIGLPGQDTLEFHLQDSLEHLGHEAKIFDLDFAFGKGQVLHFYLRKVSERYDRSKAIRLAKKILDYEPDIVMATYRFVHPDTIDYIKKANSSIIAVHLNPDALINLQQQQVIASNYDFLFTKEPFMQRFLKDMAGLNAHYLPEAFNPRFHKAPDADRETLEQKVDTDVLFYGNMYPYRVRIIEQLLDPKWKIKLFGVRGRYFPAKLDPYFMNRVIINQDKSLQVWGSRIILNCFHYSEIEGVNCKYFEINGIGGFQLCDYKDSLSRYSEISPDKYAFKNIKEAKELIHHYLQHPEERHSIAIQQRKYFLQHHTYENRMKEMLDIIRGNLG